MFMSMPMPKPFFSLFTVFADERIDLPVNLTRLSLVDVTAIIGQVPIIVYKKCAS